MTLTPDGDGMYPLEITQKGKTKHSKHCTANFGRRDPKCHRCRELTKGIAPRNGWQPEYYNRKRNEVQGRFSW